MTSLASSDGAIGGNARQLLAQRAHSALADAGVNRLLCGGPRRSRLTRRIAVLTESRAGALEVQAADSRWIERDLHDGTQARLVAVSFGRTPPAAAAP